jgi:hypothetical protein
MPKYIFTLADIQEHDTFFRTQNWSQVKDRDAFHSLFEVEIDPFIAGELYSYSNCKMKHYHEMRLNIDPTQSKEALELCRNLLNTGIVKWSLLHEQCQLVLDAVFETAGNQKGGENETNKD